jgi:TatD DNase family protein
MNEFKLFDSHCHLDFDVFRHDLEAYIVRARQAGVERIMIPTIGPQNWQRVIQLVHDHDGFNFSLGIHPYFLHDVSQDAIAQLELQLDKYSGTCVAVGECGLDGMIEVSEIKQRQFFLSQITLAQQFNLPMILHSRKTHAQITKYLRQNRFLQGGIIHGFSGSYEQAMQFVDLGFKIGVGGTITYPRAQKTRRAMQQLDIRHLVLETDAPDMPVHGHQGEPNQSCYLPLILTELARLKDQSPHIIARQLWLNTCRVFQV